MKEGSPLADDGLLERVFAGPLASMTLAFDARTGVWAEFAVTPR